MDLLRDHSLAFSFGRRCGLVIQPLDRTIELKMAIAQTAVCCSGLGDCDVPDDQELVPAVTSPGGTAETTGRWVVTFADEDEADLEATLRGAGVSHVASSRDFAEQVLDVGQAQAGDAVVLAELGVAVVSAEPAQVTAMRAAAPGAILSVEPEYVHHILSLPGSDYLRGYQDGVTDLSS